MWVMVINPRRACAARVTELGLRESWSAMFSTTGGKGKGQRGKEGKEGGGKKEVKVQIREENSNFVHEWVKCY